ncbi:MAG: DUF1232 domain-containing protein [Desulfamplus sp.]|nr:DUF1232 domain-containing protein [Desulfamplus sp.]
MYKDFINKEKYELYCKYKQIHMNDVEKAYLNADYAITKTKKSPFFYNDKMSEDMDSLVSMLKDYRMGYYRKVPWRSITLVIIAILYIVNPWDIMPDITPIIGLIDDAGVVGVCIKSIKDDLEEYKVWKKALSKLVPFYNLELGSHRSKLMKNNNINYDFKSETTTYSMQKVI